jgi:two-component system chemotaxis response regulator CheY
MVRVTDVEDEEAPTVLIVDNNQMAIHRLKQIFNQRGFSVEICEDGDKAVDEYIRLSPELVVMALDIPSLDGHLAALEMREHGGDCRLILTAPSRQADLAIDAAFSAGAVAWLEKPISAKTVEAVWENVLGPIPEAPGLDDLDDLYPDDGLQKITVEDDNTVLVLPEPIINTDNDTVIEVPVTTPKKKSSRGKRLVAILVLFSLIGGLIWYFRDNLPF